MGGGKDTAPGELAIITAALHGHQQATHLPGLPCGHAHPIYCCERSSPQNTPRAWPSMLKFQKCFKQGLGVAVYLALA